MSIACKTAAHPEIVATDKLTSVFVAGFDREIILLEITAPINRPGRIFRPKIIQPNTAKPEGGHSRVALDVSAPHSKPAVARMK